MMSELTCALLEPAQLAFQWACPLLLATVYAALHQCAAPQHIAYNRPSDPQLSRTAAQLIGSKVCLA